MKLDTCFTLVLVAFFSLAAVDASLSTRSRPVIQQGIRKASTKTQTEFPSKQLSAKEVLVTATGMIAASFAMAKYCPPPFSVMTEQFDSRASIREKVYFLSTQMRLINYLAWQEAQQAFENFLESAKKKVESGDTSEEEKKEGDGKI
jgi:hypothetical protein